ncbi:hypothetical protein ABZY03_00400 [Streptomyces klenkii]|uniref:hypothetical protein n=1 Tax=Streptomyces klenkii TaxID=1420899 RepID=UPI00339E4265
MTTTPPSRRPKRHDTTTRPDIADKAALPVPGCGQGKAARQGVLSALPPEQRPAAPPRGDGRIPVAWLHICAPRGAVPTATSWCVCGRDRSAIGHAKVLALAEDHAAHRALCPLRTAEGRNAA